MILFAGDTRALPKGSGQTDGSCTSCWSKGIFVKAKNCNTHNTFYVDHVSRASPPLRARIKAELTTQFRGAPQFLQVRTNMGDHYYNRHVCTSFLQRLTEGSPPVQKTHDSIVAACKVVAADTKSHDNPEHACKTQGYHYLDVFARMFVQGFPWDSSRRFAACTPHTAMNSGRNLFELVGGTGKVGEFNHKRRSIELSFGEARLRGLAGNTFQLFEYTF